MAFNISTPRSASSGIGENDFVLVNGCRHYRYSLNKEGMTEIRVVPAIGPDGTVQPLLGEDGQIVYDALTDAVAIVDMVSFLGPGKAHMICPSYPGEKSGPVHTLVYKILDTVEHDPKNADDKWLRWCGKGADHPKNVMSTPAQVALLQGFLYTHKGKACLDKEGKETVRSPVLLNLNRSATNDMMDKLSKPLDANGRWGSNNNQLGDFVDLEHGRMLRISPYAKIHNNREQTWYKVECCDEMPITVDEALTVWKPWDQVINYQPSLCEVGIWLMKAFDAQTVIDVFSDHPTYFQCISDTVRMAAEREAAAAVGRTTLGYSAPPPVYPPVPQPAPVVPESAAPRQDIPAPPARPPRIAPTRQERPAEPPEFQMLGDDAALPFDNNNEEPERPSVNISESTVRRARRS